MEVNEHWWWHARFTAAGFVRLDELSEIVRGHQSPKQSKHLAHGLQVFLNPRVASLPQHKHLFGGKGCFSGVITGRNGGALCTGADALPADYESLLDCSRARPSGHKDGEPVKWLDIPWTCEMNPRLKK